MESQKKNENCPFDISVSYLQSLVEVSLEVIALCATSTLVPNGTHLEALTSQI